MSVSTQLSVRGLARDPSVFKAAEVGAMRRAENVVMRSEGVAESRPNFDILRETIGTSKRVRSLFEFGGDVYAIESDNSFVTWTASSGTGTLTPPIAGAFQPIFYDQDEAKFAQSRGNLYFGGIYGPLAIEGSSGPSRMVGVDMRYSTDWALAGTGGGGTLSLAYRFVFVKKDTHGYIRRSPPSERVIITNAKPGYYGFGTRFYFPSQLAAGDQVEFYRSIATSGLNPRPESYLAFTYTLTSSDISNTYFVPPLDTTVEGALGAQLYSDASQEGITAAKYRPPIASSMAWWARCMWYGRVVEAQRLTLTLQNMFYAGNPIWAGDFSVTSGSPTATAADATGLFVGMLITDNTLYGPTVAGPSIPANTTITAISGTTITLSANATATVANAIVGAYLLNAPDGLSAYTLVASGTTGTNSITVASTKGLHVGMYFTDVAWTSGGTTQAGSAVPALTKITSITNATTFTISHNLTNTMTSATTTAGDIVTVNSIDFYALIGDTTAQTPWTGAFPEAYRAFFIGDTSPANGTGPSNIGLALQNLAVVVNYYSLTNPTYRVNAIINGDRWDLVNKTFVIGLRNYPGSLPVSITFEEGAPSGGLYQTQITVSSSAANAFVPKLPQSSDNTTRPNRIYFSDLDEPEAVPLVNFFDVGLLDEPIQALVTLRNCLLVFKTDGLWRISGSGPSSWSVEQVDTTLRLVSPTAVATMNGVAYAWCDRGFFVVDESSVQSLSANALDVELRAAAAFVLDRPTSHGVFVCTWRQRNIVLLGVPSGNTADYAAKVYCYSATTGQWSEWPVAWNTACGAFYGDTMYIARHEDGVVDYEIRVGTVPRGYDRQYAVVGDVSGATVTIADAAIGQWEPAIGDFLGIPVGGGTYYRRLTGVSLVSTTWTLTLESAVTGASGTKEMTAREAAIIKMEWQPSAPSGVPMGSICRELQPQVDLRDGDQKTVVSIPNYVCGASSELSPTVYTNTSNADRVLSVQPLRFGASRQIARSANVAPYFETSDIFPLRVVGMSLVFEPTSERTRR